MCSLSKGNLLTKKKMVKVKTTILEGAHHEMTPRKEKTAKCEEGGAKHPDLNEGRIFSNCASLEANQRSNRHNFSTWRTNITTESGPSSGPCS